MIENVFVIYIENRKIPTDLRDDALKLQQQTDWDDAGGEGWIYCFQKKKNRS
jgi:hypothetical protein